MGCCSDHSQGNCYKPEGDGFNGKNNRKGDLLLNLPSINKTKNKREKDFRAEGKSERNQSLRPGLHD
jgi:hypothetical protein